MYQRITLQNEPVSASVGVIESGKILIVSIIEPNGKNASDYVSSITISPSVATTSGGWYLESKMTYFKITTTATYTVTVLPQSSLSVATKVDLYMFTVDSIDGFDKYDALEGISGSNNYVISSMPENLGEAKVSLDNLINNTSSTISSVNDEPVYQKTTLIDGSERYLPTVSSKKFVRKENSSADKKASSEKVSVGKSIIDIVEKINNNDRLSMKELKEYNSFIKENNLTPVSTLSAIDTSQLGEYGYYLSKSKINGNANVFWEHVSKYGIDMYYGILLQNTGSTSINVTLNRRSYDSFNESGPSSLTSVWSDYFKNIKKSDISDLPISGTLTIPANTSKWIALYKVSSDNYSNIFTGQVSISLKNSNETAYTGSNVYCYSFIMSDWENSSGQTMYETVKANVGNGSFTRADGAPSSNQSDHASGSGNGAVLAKNFNSVIDITNDRCSYILGGYDAPILNSGEMISLYHDGVANGGTSGYTIPNALNYGVVYKLSFNGFNSSFSTENIKLRLKYNALVSPAAVAAPDGGVYVTVMCSEFSSTPYTTVVGGRESDYSSQATVPWNITKNTDFDLYIVIGGMSSLPLEVE